MYCTVQYCTVLYCTVLYCTVLYCTVLYGTVQLYTVISIMLCRVMSCHCMLCHTLSKSESNFSSHICAAVWRPFSHPSPFWWLHWIWIFSSPLFVFSFCSYLNHSFLTILADRIISQLIVCNLSFILSYLLFFHSPSLYFISSHTYVLTTPDLYSRFPKLYVPVDFVRLNVSSSISIAI